MGSRVVLRIGTRISPGLLKNSGTPNRSARTGVPVTKRKTFACLAASAAVAAYALSASQGSANAAAHAPAPVSKHVLLISVDGMHQSDLDWYVANHPSSTLAKLTHSGSEYTNAATSNPSDSDPGGTALMTGGNPKSTGVYYDVEYSHKVDEAGAAVAEPRHVEFERTRGVDFTFAPRATTVLDLALETPGKPMWDRPDLGIGAGDVHVSKGTIRVTVHSLGSVPAPASTVTLIDAVGHELARAQVPGIPAPLDLLPKTAQVTLHVASGVQISGAKVRVQVSDHSQEITQLNNEVVVP